MGRLAVAIVALAAAAMTAMLAGSFAHDDLGIAIDTIRSDALVGAAVIFAGVACRVLLTRNH